MDHWEFSSFLGQRQFWKGSEMSTFGKLVDSSEHDFQIEEVE